MGFHGISCNFMGFNGISWGFMGFNGTLFPLLRVFPEPVLGDAPLMASWCIWGGKITEPPKMGIWWLYWHFAAPKLLLCHHFSRSNLEVPKPGETMDDQRLGMMYYPTIADGARTFLGQSERWLDTSHDPNMMHSSRMPQCRCVQTVRPNSTQNTPWPRKLQKRHYL